MTKNNWRFAAAGKRAIQCALSDQPKGLPDRVVRGGTGGRGGKGCTSEFLFHCYMASDGVAHDARYSGWRKTRLIFMIKVKVKGIFASHAAQARAGNYVSARALFVIPCELCIGCGILRCNAAW